MINIASKWTVVKNLNTLINIHELNRGISSYQNYGYKLVKNSLLAYYIEWVWYHHDGINKVLTLGEICKKLNDIFDGYRGELHENLPAVVIIWKLIPYGFL